MTHTTQIEKDIQSLKNNTISDYNFTTIISKYLKVYNYDKLIRIIRSYKFARTINGYKSLIRYFTDFDNKDLFDSFCTEDIIEIFSTMVNMYHKVVAIFGWIIPEPLAIPKIFIKLFPI